MFREKGIRLIAMSDGIDTAVGEDEFMPFRNIIAEWHARDTSRKIKAVYKTKGMSGKHTASHALYGYVKSEADKNQWVVDPEAAEVAACCQGGKYPLFSLFGKIIDSGFGLCYTKRKFLYC